MKCAAQSKRSAALRKLARSLDPEPEHAFQVCKLALVLFDETRALHGLGPGHRPLLEAGALLHDIGHVRGLERHHKHSRDIILETALPDFSDRERRIIACLARYHRKADPQPGHKYYRDLGPGEQSALRKLAGILRIADGLDRSHRAACKGIRAVAEAEGLHLFVAQGGGDESELWGAERKKALLEKELGTPILLKLDKNT